MNGPKVEVEESFPFCLHEWWRTRSHIYGSFQLARLTQLYHRLRSDAIPSWQWATLSTNCRKTHKPLIATWWLAAVLLTNLRIVSHWAHSHQDNPWDSFGLGGECREMSFVWFGSLSHCTLFKQNKPPGQRHAVTVSASLGWYCPKRSLTKKKNARRQSRSFCFYFSVET